MISNCLVSGKSFYTIVSNQFNSGLRHLYKGSLILSLALLSVLQPDPAKAQCPNVGVNPNITTFNGCAPYTFSYSAVYPSSGPIPTGITYEVFADWGDGITSITPATIGVNASGNPSILASPSHVYPHFSDPTLGECVYTVKTTLLANGVKCDDVNYDFAVRVWDNDGYRGGKIGISPSPVYICSGEAKDIVIDDVSSWNCTGNVGTKNLGYRTIRWDYGENISGTSIPGITITKKDASGNVIGIENMDVTDVLQGELIKYDDGMTQPDSRGQSLTIHVPATTPADVWKTFWIRLNNWNYCNPYGVKPPESATARIEILPIPDPQFTGPIGPFCEGADAINLDSYLTSNFFPNQLAFREFTGDGVTYNSSTKIWYFDPAVAGPGNHTISYRETNQGGCDGTDQIQIQVTNGAIAKFVVNGKDENNATSNVCGASNVRFSNTSTNADSYEWDFGDGTPVLSTTSTADIFHPYSATSGTYLVTLRAIKGGGCTDTETKTIKLNPPVTASFTATPISGCSPLDVSFTGTSVNALQYRWLFNDGSPNTTTTKNTTHQFINLTLKDTIYDVRFVAMNNATGCRDTTPPGYRPINVFAPATAGDDQIICSTFSANFNATVSGGNGTWSQVDGPDLAVITDIHDPKSSVTVPFPGTYKFKWDVVGGCGSTDEVTINFVPTALPNAGNDAALCDLNYVLRATPSSGTGTWSQVSGPGTASFAFINRNITNVTVNVQGDYVFRWSDDPGFGCNSAYDEVMVSFSNPPVQPSFTYTPSAGCSPLTVTFTNSSPAGASNFEWDFGDGNILQTEDKTVIHTYVNGTSLPIDFAVHLKAGLNVACTRVTSKIVTVDEEFEVGYPVTYSGCGPLTRTFENAYPWAFSVRWEDENGVLLSTDLKPTLTFNALNGVETTHKVYLVGQSASGCIDRIENIVIVRVPPVAAFSPSLTSGCAPLNVAFTNQSSLDATSFQWNFGDGSEISISPNPSHTFVVATGAQANFNVQLTARNQFGCTAASNAAITVLPTPQADFTATPQVQTFPDRTVQVTNLTPPGTWTYSWNFGDLSAPQTGNVTQHVYNSPGNYSITLTSEGAACKTSRSIGISIYPGAALAAFEPDTAGCVPLTVKFRNNSVNGFRYLWDFGNGSHSTDFEPTNTYYNEGTFKVRLETYNFAGDRSVEEKTIVVHPKPNAFFRALPDRVRIPGQSVNFANFSTFADNLQWDFGDGTTSREFEPVHQYSQTGFYDVSLIISSTENCTDTFLLAKGVEAYSEGELRVPNAFMPSKDGPSGGVFTPGDPHNHIFYPSVVAGDLEKYEMQIFNRWGNLIFQSQEPERGWDGYYNETLCPQDVYVWKIKCRFLNGYEVTQTGDVTLIQ